MPEEAGRRPARRRRGDDPGGPRLRRYETARLVWDARLRLFDPLSKQHARHGDDGGASPGRGLDQKGRPRRQAGRGSPDGLRAFRRRRRVRAGQGHEGTLVLGHQPFRRPVPRHRRRLCEAPDDPAQLPRHKGHQVRDGAVAAADLAARPAPSTVAHRRLRGPSAHHVGHRRRGTWDGPSPQVRYQRLPLTSRLAPGLHPLRPHPRHAEVRLRPLMQRFGSRPRTWCRWRGSGDLPSRPHMPIFVGHSMPGGGRAMAGVRTAVQKVIVAGSEPRRPSGVSSASMAAMSSASSLNARAPMFSLSLPSLTDFGITTRPLSRCHRMMT